MSRDPFWITDLRSGRHHVIDQPLSDEADDLLRRVHETGTSAVRPQGRLLECRAHDDDPALSGFQSSDGRVHDIWLYVRSFNGRWVICHHPFKTGSGNIKFTDHVIETTGESDQHKRLKDLWQEAFEGGGCQVVQEQQVGGRRFDVQATTRDGSLIVLESDHSTHDARTALFKERKDQQLGVKATIFCADKPRPTYADRVAHTEVNELGEITRPHPSEWLITRGPRWLHWVKCRPSSPWARCPEIKSAKTAGYKYCGSEHPFFTLWMDRETLSVGAVGELLPAGELVVARPHLQRIDACLLSRQHHMELTEYLTTQETAAVEEAKAGAHWRSISPDEMGERRQPKESPASTPEPERVVVVRRDVREVCSVCHQLGPCADGECMSCRWRKRSAEEARQRGMRALRDRAANAADEPDKPWLKTLQATLEATYRAQYGDDA